MKHFLAFILFFVGIISLASCDKESLDGNWEKIRFTVDGKELKGANYEVSAGGGTYIVGSSNYKSLWLNEVRVDEQTIWPIDYDWTTFETDTIRGEWATIYYNDDKNAVVEIKRNDSDKERNLRLCFEYGDAFRDLIIKQKAN